MALWGLFGKKAAAPVESRRREPSLRLRPQVVVKRFYDGARSDRLTLDWTTQPMPADEVIRRHQRVLVARSREQAANNDYARAFVRMCRQNIVGPQGVMLQARSRDERGALDVLANEAIEKAFAEWGKRSNCDVAGKRSWRAIQASAIVSVVKDGEFMLRKIYGADAGPWGFALQVLDPQRCPVQLDDDGLSDGRFIRHGIEFNRYGRPIAYYFAASDRSDYSATYSHAGRDYLRVPADEIIHGFLEDMAGQKRGLPWMATGLFRMKQLVGFEDASIVNARVGAGKMGVMQWRDGQGPDPGDDAPSDYYMDVRPGEFAMLPEGVELKEWSPQFPSGEFSVFNKAMLRGIAAGFGVLYNNLANDLEHVNFSSIRQGTLDEREHWKEMQQWLIEELCESVLAAWLPVALLSGRITVKGKALKPERLPRYSAVMWQPRRWAWIDPKSDIDASVTAKNQMLMAPSQIIREQGRDPSDVWREIAADIREMEEAGIPADYVKSAILDTNLQATVMAQTAQAEARINQKDEDHAEEDSDA